MVPERLFHFPTDRLIITEQEITDSPCAVQLTLNSVDAPILRKEGVSLPTEVFFLL